MLSSLARKSSTLLVIIGSLVACSPTATVTPTPSQTASPVLTRYATPTPSRTPSGIPPTVTPFPSPTPTPFTYAVKKDDDMFGVALRFGVSLPALKTANPKINPYYMGVGTVLVIPVTPGASGTPGVPTATSTPSPVTVSQVNCYASADGGLWCLALATNQTANPVENLSVIFRISGKNPDVRIDQSVYAPLDVLPGGASIPVMISLPGPTPKEVRAEAQLDSQLPFSVGDPRYPSAKLEAVKTQIDGVHAQVSGRVTLSPEADRADEVWVLAVAYGDQDQLVGLRKWESSDGLSTGQSLPFDMNVYSLGPEIKRVELMVEAHAGQPAPD